MPPDLPDAYLRADGQVQTPVRRLFAGGDLATVPHSVSLAMGNGAMAGAQVQRFLYWPERRKAA